MPFSIDRIVPWGRNLTEYQAMFDLGEPDLDQRILGCGDGPASFNAELSARGHTVVSIDPIYSASAAAIERRVDETFNVLLDQMRQHSEDFVWTHVRSITELGRRRMDVMHRFIADYPRGKTEGRYVEASLPDLPFDDDAFDLALSSHCLFLYSEQFDLRFHVSALREMLRVATEVRAFPLLQIGGTPSPHVQPVVDVFTSQDIDVTIEPVAYEFQRGGNRMLRLRRANARGDSLTQVATGSYVRSMRSVGLKMLNNKLSEYVRLAAAGETVLVTDRDRVVAEIVPPRAERSPILADALLADAVRTGWLTPPAAPGSEPPSAPPPVMTLEQLMETLDEVKSDR